MKLKKILLIVSACLALVIFTACQTEPTATDVLTETPEPIATSIPTPYSEPTTTPTLTETPKPTVTPSPTLSPAPKATSTPIPSPTLEPTATSTPAPSPTPEPTATSTPIPSPKPTATSTPIPRDPQATPPASVTRNNIIYTYDIYNDAMTVTGYTGEPTEVIIENNINGWPVSEIKESAFKYCSSLTSITIPEGVTKIGDSAFFSCGSLTSIIIPEGVTKIEDFTFEYCSSLTSITIPEGVTEIEYSAFSNCSSLTSIVIPNGVTEIGNAAFKNCSSLTSITIPEGVTEIGCAAFRDCSSLTSIVIPEGVTEIKMCTFEYCSSLTSTAIPEGVTEIGNYAFNGCDALTSIAIPEGVTEIGEGAFGNCSSLTSIAIPEGVTEIGKYAFYDCTNLINIELPKNLKIINQEAFSYTGLQTVILPEGFQGIGAMAFSNSERLAYVYIPSSIQYIGSSAFSSCSDNLTIYTSVSNQKFIDWVKATGYNVKFAEQPIPNSYIDNFEVTSTDIVEQGYVIGKTLIFKWESIGSPIPDCLQITDPDGFKNSLTIDTTNNSFTTELTYCTNGKYTFELTGFSSYAIVEYEINNVLSYGEFFEATREEDPYASSPIIYDEAGNELKIMVDNINRNVEVPFFMVDSLFNKDFSRASEKLEYLYEESSFTIKVLRILCLETPGENSLDWQHYHFWEVELNNEAYYMIFITCVDANDEIYLGNLWNTLYN